MADVAPVVRSGRRAGADPYDLGVEFTAAAGVGTTQASGQVERDHRDPGVAAAKLHGAVVTIDAMGVLARDHGADHRSGGGLCPWPERQSGDVT